nr:cytochrome c biogenesis protein CcdA [Lentibacillus saliphilus]
MLDIHDINIFIAFGAGFLSFVSPCVLPLYPAFLSYITGMSVNEISEENKMLQRKSILHTLFFLLGFSVVFLLMGGFMGTIISDFLKSYQGLIRQLGAVVIIFFGLVIVGVLRFDFLMKGRTLTFKNRPSGYIGTFLIGLAFSLGWTPCMGPILAVVISASATTPDIAMMMMISYVLGFSIPFFVLSFFIGKLTWIRKHSHLIVQVGGYLMIFVGIALFFDWLTKLTSYLANLFGFTGF